MKYIFVLVLLVFLVSACQQQNDPSALYSGTRGVPISIENSQSIRTAYFDKTDTTYNNFDILVSTRNEGSSFAIGRVFPSGFDRGLIEIVGEPFPDHQIGRFPCSFDIGKIDSWLQFGAQCTDLFDVIDIFWQEREGSGGSRGDISLDIGEIAEEILGKDLGIWESIVIDYEWDNDLGKSRFSLGSQLLPEDGVNGRLMSAFAMSYLGAAPGSDRWLDSDKFYAIDGRNIFNPVGEFQDHLFNVRINEENWPGDLPETEQQFLFTNCYAYATYATPNVCIDPQPWSSDRKVCTPGSVSLSSQGAPVAITRVDQEVTPKKVFFTIHVSHRGTGQIYDLANLYKCDPWSQSRVTERDLNVVYLGNVMFSGSTYEDNEMECTPSNKQIKLTNGQGSITCAWDMTYAPSRNAYQAPLLVELWYGYSETVQQTVTIKRIG